MRMMVLVIVAAFAFCCALMVGLRLWERRMRRRQAAQWVARERLLDGPQFFDAEWLLENGRSNVPQERNELVNTLMCRHKHNTRGGVREARCTSR